MNRDDKINDVHNHSEAKLPDMNNPESDESKKVQTHSLEAANTLDDINGSRDKIESSAIVKDTSRAAGSIECSMEDSCKEVEIKTDQCDKKDGRLKEILFTSINSVDASEATTSQDNSPSSFHGRESNTLYADQNKVKRSISRGQIHVDSGVSMERSSDSSDEDSSKRQKLNENVHDTENSIDDAVIFQKTNSKVRQRNYRKRRNITSDNEDSSGNVLFSDTIRREVSQMRELDADEGNIASASANELAADNEALDRNSETHERGSEITGNRPDRDEHERGDSNEWTTASEDEMDEEDEDEEPHCLKIKKPRPDWYIVQEIMNRQIGNNPLFPRRFYGSLHVVERLELMYQLDEHQGCVNALNFNQKGNLLASGSDDLAVVIWDWAIGKKRHWFQSGHCSNMFQAKWLPLDAEYLMVTCGRDGQVRLLDLRHDTSRRLASHHGPSHKLAVHSETPHVVISVGEDAKVLSIDIRERKPNKLLVVKEGASEVQLYSVHSNPLNSNEFCVGGRSHYVRVYDRRKVSTPLYKLCPDHLTGNKNAHVTCAVYNYNGTEILASYNDEDIYLFDKLKSPRIDYAHRYQGHRNNATVKGVNFFGPKSEYVISGSDCGNIFIWDKNTEAVVQWMAGDQQGVVNCLEGHPHIPVLATSGLDYDVKIWVPSCEKPPDMKHFATCVKSNARNRKRENEPDAFDGQMLWILLRHMRHTQRVRNLYRRGSEDRDRDEDDDVDVVYDYQLDDSSNDNSSEQSDSQSDGDVGRLQCPPS